MEISCLCDTSLNSKESQCVNCLVFGQWLWCFKSASKQIKARLTSLLLLQDWELSWVANIRHQVLFDLLLTSAINTITKSIFHGKGLLQHTPHGPSWREIRVVTQGQELKHRSLRNAPLWFALQVHDQRPFFVPPQATCPEPKSSTLDLSLPQKSSIKKASQQILPPGQSNGGIFSTKVLLLRLPKFVSSWK